LHWAAFHGNKPMTLELLKHHPSLEETDKDFSGTPLRWAIHGSENGWHKATGDYAGVVEVLLAAGSTPPKKISGTKAVQEILARKRGS
jgi:hypothetical protein